MNVLDSRLDGPLLLEPVVHGDERGFFQETFRQNVFAALGISDQFVQDNHSRSRRGIVRGMHFQPGMAKLVRCVRGEIFDVVVDLRRSSPTFGEWEGFKLDDVSHHQVYCPDGFAHGFCVVSAVADVVYKTSDYYRPDLEAGFAYDDPAVGIAWPQIELTPSPRDARAPRLAEIADGLPFQ